MSNSRARTRLEKIQILSLVVWGLGAFMFSPPNKVGMTTTELAGLGLVGIGTLVFVTATIIRLTKWLNVKSKSG